MIALRDTCFVGRVPVGCATAVDDAGTIGVRGDAAECDVARVVDADDVDAT